MALWSLTEERVNELIKQMNNKKQEHDILEATAIFDLWNSDLDKMMEVLEEIETREEDERVRQGGVNNNGKRKKKKGPVKAAVKANAQ